MFEFTELDYQETPLGAISLRRRSEPRLGGKVLYEVKLGEEFLMSSLFVEAEEELAALALQSLNAEELNVVVGGLGLGYTAAKALENEAVRSLLV
ncbi:MAG: spermidine synthase, partial [Pseudomonadota bacterium]|nr:spermidine synthase [Pseudomonadota bacterium]